MQDRQRDIRARITQFIDVSADDFVFPLVLDARNALLPAHSLNLLGHRDPSGKQVADLLIDVIQYDATGGYVSHRNA